MRLFDLLDGVSAAAGLFLRPWRWRVPETDSVSLTQRLAALPTSSAPVKAPVQISWDEHQVPFIEAESDEDLAVALGVVHVHLRWAQMELMRRIARGRLAEIVGPFGLILDKAIHTIGLARAVPDIVAMLPDDTRQWLTGFVSGVNHAIRSAPALPMEMRALDIGRSDWTIEDILAIGRLSSVDITWMSFMGMLGAPDQDFARLFWKRLVGLDPAPDAAGDDGALAQALRNNGKMGSNSFALMSDKSASGAALMANDPHLGALLPNLWLIAGYKSPSYHLAGFMIPGVPMAALGRNPWISWGGTNLHAMSSDLFDVTDLPAAEITERRETVKVRGRRDRTIIIRETKYGPIVSDLTFFPGRGKQLALRWVGHNASDELTSMLRVNRARNWDDFRAALDGFAAPAQNMVYADAQGHIGKLIAAHLPLRPNEPPEAHIQPRGHHRHWRTLATANDLPTEYDPPSGFIASANDKPSVPTPIPVGFFFSTPHRIERFKELLGPARNVTLGDISRFQRDVTVPGMLTFRDTMLRLLKLVPQTADAKAIESALTAWNGAYSEDSAGPLAFETMVFHLGRALLGPRLPMYARSWDTRGMIHEDVRRLDDNRARAIVQAAIPGVAKALTQFGTWGSIHRLRLPHPLARLPILGRKLYFGDWPVGGNGETISKSGYGLTDQRHFAGLVAVSRHVSDMADLDANHFVLLGGQDGWLGSTTVLDQVPLWRSGTYIQVPLRTETVYATFRHKTTLTP
ncbi:MAG TPA: penicillin acylase family protein [Magnetospirillaceae bacterium]|jgi:penicillin amidase